MTAVMAHNKFSDWSDEERQKLGGNGYVGETEAYAGLDVTKA